MPNSNAVMVLLSFQMGSLVCMHRNDMLRLMLMLMISFWVQFNSLSTAVWQSASRIQFNSPKLLIRQQTYVTIFRNIRFNHKQIITAENTAQHTIHFSREIFRIDFIGEGYSMSKASFTFLLLLLFFVIVVVVVVVDTVVDTVVFDSKWKKRSRNSMHINLLFL